jgi:hypothetical protein
LGQRRLPRAFRNPHVSRALFGMQFWGAFFVTILLFFARDWGHF